MNSFIKAEKHQSKLRLAIIGPSGSGKTYSALGIATGLAQGGKIAVIDTERGSASLYAGIFSFDVLSLDSFSPSSYVEAITKAEEAGYKVIVVDSLSHAWMGKDGALELVDREAARSQSKNTFAAWRNVTPIHNRMVDKLVGCNAHIICTMRSKMEYVMEKDDKGKTTIRKVGLQPIQRDGLDFEFTLCGDIDQEHKLVISKSRCPAFADAVIEKPGAQFAEGLLAWLNDGAPEKAEQKEMALPANPPPPTTTTAEDKAVTEHLKVRDEFETLCKDNKEACIAWLLKNKWIKDGEGLLNVSLENMNKALSRKAAFLTAVKATALENSRKK